MKSAKTAKTTDKFADLRLPDLQPWQLEELVSQGSLSPEQAQAFLLDKSAMEDVQSDSTSRKAQFDALSQLTDIADSGGLTATDRFMMDQIQDQEQAAERGSREAILQNAAARGVGGSGLELMAQLKNQQESANRQSDRDLGVASQAQQARMAALNSMGSLGGQINQQDFAQQSAKAQAQDAIAQFNAANRQNVNLQNVATNNNAQAANLQNKQNIANSNVATRNQQQQYNKNLPQQQFNNEISKRGGSQGAANFNANAQSQQNANDAAAWNNTLSTAAGIGTAVALSDKNQKKNLEPIELTELLDKITGFKYKYKDEKNGAGDQVGVMAQDVEKIAPQAVINTEDGKAIDYNKMGGPMLAALAEMAGKIKKLEGKE